jgi:RNA polymerase sigma-70 factor (ECF subfamily)
MSEVDPSKLSQINTAWSIIQQAHQGGAAAQAAQQELLRRYGEPIRRYLLAATGDAHSADDLYQEFALQLLQGRLRGADPERGRFRHFVKGVLRHLLADHHRAQQRRNRPLPAGVEVAAPIAGEDLLDEGWREQLLAQAWRGLEEHERQTGQPFHTVLRARAEDTKLRSAALAETLSARLGRTLTADWVRQNLHRARTRFAALLTEAVADSLTDAAPERVMEELADLKLLDYVRPALA